MTNYKRYKALKAQFNYEYNGYKLDSAVAPELILLAYKKKQATLINILKNLVRYKPLSLTLKNKVKALITLSSSRSDYKNLTDAYIKKLELNHQAINIEQIKPIVRLGVKHFASSLKESLSIKNVRFFEKLYLASVLVYYKRMIDDLESVEHCSTEVYYAFNGSWMYENLLTSYFKKRKILTYSFQHGMYFNFAKPIPLDIINYENMTSDYLLCWSDYTIDEMVQFGIHKSKLIKTGNPLYVQKFENRARNEIFKKALVFLARDSYSVGNRLLIDALTKQRDILFELKLHPSLDYQVYYDYIESHKNLFLLSYTTIPSELLRQEYDFVVTYNTTVHYESLAKGFLSFGFEYEKDGGILFESFKTYNDLRELIVHYQLKESHEVNTKIEEMAFYSLGIS